MLVPEYAKARVGAFAKLAEIQLCMVGTSVEDERLFSSLAFVHNKQRNRLDKHLEACVRVRAQRFFNDATFPYKDALAAWYERRSRRGGVQQRCS